MTAEIVIMNKTAVALAADSAVTIGDTEKDIKIYDTVNKLFALSRYHPVGIMVFGSSDFMGIPWETIIKEFRKTIVEERPYLEKYAEDFISFIEDSEKIPTENYDYSSNMESGIVIAGFGSKEFFPSCFSFITESLKNGQLTYKMVKNRKIDLKNNASIIPFAQHEMVNTFMEGISPNLKEVIDKSLRNTFEGFSKEILSNIPESEDIKAVAQSINNYFLAAYENIINDLNAGSWQLYVSKVLDAVAVLPKDKISALAESLINLTIIRKIYSTTEKETVGGPIDVALISKGDGFIWIKRKHYFKPEMNPQYFYLHYYLNPGASNASQGDRNHH